MPALSGRARSTSPVPIGVTLLLLLIFPAVTSGQLLQAATLGVIYAIACVGLDMFSGYGGQLSFGHFAFVAIGAYTSAYLTSEQQWAAWATLPVAVLVAAGVGAVLSIPTVRLPDLGVALVTIFFGYVVYQLLMGKTLRAITHSVDGLPVTPLQLNGHDLSQGSGLFYASFVALAVVAGASWLYANSRAGVSLRVAKRSSAVAAANGLRADRLRRLALIYSAGTAGLAGFFYAQDVGFLSPDSFGTLASVNMMAMAVVGGLGSIAGPIYGAVFFAVLTEETRNSGSWSQITFPLLLLVALVAMPEGLYGLGERVARWSGLNRLAARIRRQPAAASALPAADIAPSQGSDSRPSTVRNGHADVLLELDNVSIHFGGVVALDRVTIDVAAGDIHAIIGPNGAGKTTLLNCISGVQRYEGRARLRDRALTGLDPRRIRQAGVARTFQAPSLVPDLTVIENVMVGAAAAPGPRALWSRRRSRTRQLATTALDLLQFDAHRRDRLASELSLAEQKIVDVARAIAGQPDVVLLDEPTAGLGEQDMDLMADVLLGLRAAGITVVVIAHHISFLRQIADSLTVLDFGRVLGTGDPEELLSRRDVVDIYLGAANV